MVTIPEKLTGTNPEKMDLLASKIRGLSQAELTELLSKASPDTILDLQKLLTIGNKSTPLSNTDVGVNVSELVENSLESQIQEMLKDIMSGELGVFIRTYTIEGRRDVVLQKGKFIDQFTSDNGLKVCSIVNNNGIYLRDEYESIRNFGERGISSKEGVQISFNGQPANILSFGFGLRPLEGFPGCMEDRRGAYLALYLYMHSDKLAKKSYGRTFFVNSSPDKLGNNSSNESFVELCPKISDNPKIRLLLAILNQVFSNYTEGQAINNPKRYLEYLLAGLKIGK